MRNLGCLVVAIAALAVTLFFADQAVTSSAESQTAHRVAQALDAETEVDFDGWPVAGHMLLGSIPTARINATDVPMERGGTFKRLDVELTEVEVDISSIRGEGGRPQLPPAEAGTFSAELSEGSVADLIGLPAGIADVSLGDGAVTISAAGLEVKANLEARDGDVVVSLAGPIAEIIGGAEFPIDLSDLPGAPAAEQVDVVDGVMTISGRLEDI